MPTDATPQDLEQSPPVLHGVRILDLSTYTPGPFGTQILADLGATVLKVERPGTGDLERVTVPPYFRAYNRGKHSVVLDLRAAEDRALCLELAADADVVVEGFRPGVVDRLGVGYGDVVAVNPDVVYVSLSGYGSTGPLALDPGHDPEYMARTGALALSPRRPDGTPIHESAFVVADYAAGMYAVIGVLASLARPASLPVHLEVPVAAACLAWAFPKLHEHRTAGPRDAEIGGIGIFPTADGGFVTISASDEAAWHKLALAVGHPEWVADPSVQSRAERKAAGATINDAIRAFTSGRSRAECMEVLLAGDVSAAPVLSVDEVFEDPAIGHWAILHRTPSDHVDLPVFGLARRTNVRAPELGEDDDAVRRDGWRSLEGGG